MKFSDRSDNLGSVSGLLDELGLKKSLGNLYVALLVSGQCSASKLAAVAKIDRADVYKRLEQLTNAGLCNVRLGRPKTYHAVSPTTVFESLLRKRSDALSQLNQSIYRMEPFLQRFSTAQKYQAEDSSLSYELVSGRKEVYSAARSLLDLANKEVMRIISPNSLRRTQKYGLLDGYVEAKQRGAGVRIMTDVSKLPRDLRDFCNTNFELRHSSETWVKVLIIDRSMSMLMGSLDDKNMSMDSLKSRSLVAKDAKLSDALSMMFDEYWKSARAFRAKSRW